MLENISLAFQGIWGHKLRSFLTMLGIIIGIASIITIVSTIKGTNEIIKQNLVGSGNNVVEVQLYQENYPYDLAYSPIPDGVLQIDDTVKESLLKKESIQDIATYTSRQYADSIYYKDIAFSGNIYGIDDHYLKIYNYSLSYGKNFSADDFGKGRKVAIIDDVAVSTLFEGENPIGKTLEIKEEPFTVIGVVSEHSKFKPTINSLSDYYMYMNRTAGAIFIPGNAWSTIYRYDEPKSVAVKATSTDDMTKAGQVAADVLTKSLITNTETKLTYQSEDLLGQAKELQEISTSSNRQLIWIASISLLVGGIGVMNIMLVSVTERTSEIGLKKAIGAKRKKILWQFLTEAATLTSLGGVLGILAGIGLAYVMSSLTAMPVAISIPAALIAFAFSMIIGVIFGLLPAMKAAKLNPIEALRSE